MPECSGSRNALEKKANNRKSTRNRSPRERRVIGSGAAKTLAASVKNRPKMGQINHENISNFMYIYG